MKETLTIKILVNKNAERYERISLKLILKKLRGKNRLFSYDLKIVFLIKLRFEIVKEKQKPEESIDAFSKYKITLLKTQNPLQENPEGG